jgi:hypothetical protein
MKIILEEHDSDSLEMEQIEKNYDTLENVSDKQSGPPVVTIRTLAIQWTQLSLLLLFSTAICLLSFDPPTSSEYASYFSRNLTSSVKLAEMNAIRFVVLMAYLVQFFLYEIAVLLILLLGSSIFRSFPLCLRKCSQSPTVEMLVRASLVTSAIWTILLVIIYLAYFRLATPWIVHLSLLSVLLILDVVFRYNFVIIEVKK